jgi:hypothetical protein
MLMANTCLKKLLPMGVFLRVDLLITGFQNPEKQKLIESEATANLLTLINGSLVPVIM